MLEVRPAGSDEDLGHVVRIVTEVSPEAPVTVEEMRWSDEAYPGGRRFLAWLDGVAVGAGGAGRVYIYPPEFEGLWGNISVMPEHRRKGVGSALLAAMSHAAREQAKTMLIGRTTADRPEAIEFLEHRGFREHERMKIVRLELDSLELLPLEPPDGVVITSLEARPELVQARAPGRGVEPHDGRGPRLARSRNRDGPEARDDRLGARERGGRARGRERHGQRADAGREQPPRLPAAAGRDPVPGAPLAGPLIEADL